MKRLVAIAVLLTIWFAASNAWARITLTAASTDSMQINGVTVDTANVAAVTSVTEDFIAQTLTVTISLGSWNGTAFVPSPYAVGGIGYAAPIVVIINLATGTYQLQNANSVVTIPTAVLNSLIASTKAYRNSMESLANSAGLAPGAITTW